MKQYHKIGIRHPQCFVWWGRQTLQKDMVGRTWIWGRDMYNNNPLVIQLFQLQTVRVTDLIGHARVESLRILWIEIWVPLIHAQKHTHIHCLYMNNLACAVNSATSTSSDDCIRWVCSSFLWTDFAPWWLVVCCLYSLKPNKSAHSEACRL